MRKILHFILKILVLLTLARYKPDIVAVTGSIGKTSAKEAIFAVLSSKFEVRKSEKNYNNEIGLPLTILGLETKGSSLIGWLLNFVVAFLRILIKIDYPKILILEMGADKPGDISYFMDFIKPKAGVITKVGDYPAHMEFFSNLDALVREKRKLVEALKREDWAVLNFDDDKVRAMKEKTKAQILTYGVSKFADLQAANINSIFDAEKNKFLGMSFKIEREGTSVPIKLNNAIGNGQVYAALSGAAVGLIFNMNLVEISEALQKYKSPEHRMNLIQGIKDALIIDDTYNASPASMIEAFETIKLFEGRRKIGVLGDMLELGNLTEEAHKIVGQHAVGIFDVLFIIGERAKFISNEALRNGFPAGKIFEYCSSRDAALPVQNILEPNDIILVKGSHAMQMEKIVEEIQNSL